MSNDFGNVAVDVEGMVSVVVVDDVDFDDANGVVEDYRNCCAAVDWGVDGIIGWCCHGSVERRHEGCNEGLTIDSASGLSADECEVEAYIYATRMLAIDLEKNILQTDV